MIDHKAEDLPQTRLVLPAWWVSAYDTVAASGPWPWAVSGGQLGTGDLALVSGLAPAPSLIDTQALAAALDGLAAQILAGREQALNISSDELLHSAGGAHTRARRLAFERALHGLVGMRLLRRDAATGQIATLVLIERDDWRVERHGNLALTLAASTVGAETILGHADAHLDWLRAVRGETEAATFVGARPPLSLWRSIWLELTGSDQLSYLRLERAMQWDARWVSLDGAFGAPLSELLPESRTADLARSLRALGRLGRSLELHGFLDRAARSGSYLALDADAGASLIWRASRERMLDQAASHHARRVSAHLARTRLLPRAEELARACGASGGAVEQAAGLWRKVLSFAAPAEAFLALSDGSATLLSPQALFAEWCTRSLAPRLLPVPESCVPPELGAVFADVRALTGDGEEAATAHAALEEHFATFCQALVDHPEMGRNLHRVPLATLASRVSRDAPETWRQVAAQLGSLPSKLSASVVAKPSELPLSLPSFGHDQMPAVGRIAGASFRASPRAEEAAALPAESAEASGGGGDVLASRLRRTAAEELQRMRTSDPSRYVALKRSYFESLDDASRQLLVDVQRRMQPSLFEEQLRPQLVRYMVDHPGAWR